MKWWFWFYLWCSVHLLHHRMISLMMFCVHIASSYDSTDDVFCTHRIVVWFYWWCSVHTSHRRMIPLTMFCTCIALSLWFHRWCSVYTSHRIMIQQMITTRAMHRGYDSRNEFICTLDMRVMIPQMIPCVHVALQIWFSDHFMNPNNSIVMICYYSNTTIASSHESPYMIQ